MNLSIKNTGNETFISSGAIGVFGPPGDILKTAGSPKERGFILEPGQIGYLEFSSGEGTQDMLLNCPDGVPLFSVYILREEAGVSRICAMSVSEIPNLRDEFVLEDKMTLFLPTMYPTGKTSVNI